MYEPMKEKADAFSESEEAIQGIIDAYNQLYKLDGHLIIAFNMSKEKNPDDAPWLEALEDCLKLTSIIQRKDFPVVAPGDDLQTVKTKAQTAQTLANEIFALVGERLISYCNRNGEH